ncbi:MAG TPA: pyruvate kinase [Candidatus Omnitrophota bacterium]|nr:pyruvate kinase [Candidatus Omnitrophota bacterium]
MVKTKIICTLGPASSKAGILLNMMRAGMDVVRLNFSHGTLQEHVEKIRIVRQLNQRYRRRIKILGDLEGYRMRIGSLKGKQPVLVKKRQALWLTTRNIAGEGSLLPFDWAGSLKPIHAGQRVYIDDGNIALVVESRSKDTLKTRVIVGGLIKEHKGINLPGVQLDIRGLTVKDKSNILFCMEQKLDYIAQSFVRDRQDILDLKAHLKNYAHRCAVIAKIENQEGIQNIDGIIDVCDGIMVARGDMGISIPIYKVPFIQKKIIRKCNRAKKFVITATQMLESMTEHPIPTRAEVSDVANSILDGTDYVMLSGETAAGLYPAQSVRMMNEIIKFAEKNRSEGQSHGSI